MWEEKEYVKKSYLKYIVSLLIFGSNGIVASYITCSSSEIVLSRTIIGSLFLGFVFIAGGKHLNFKQIKEQWFYLLGAGISMGASWLFLFKGYQLASVSTATLAYYCGPVLVIAVAPFLFQETMTASKIIGIVMVVFGMVFVNGSDFLAEGWSWGLVCGLLSALFYAGMIIFIKKVRKLSGLESTFMQLIIAGMVIAVYMFCVQQDTMDISGQEIIPILFLGIFNTGVACYLYFSSMQALPAQSVAICSYVDPLSALLFSAVILNEHLSWLQVVGASLVLGGAAFSELYPLRKKEVKTSDGIPCKNYPALWKND
jgi:drug/metabolite transporter (DMT)-like permease